MHKKGASGFFPPTPNIVEPVKPKNYIFSKIKNA